MGECGPRGVLEIAARANQEKNLCSAGAQDSLDQICVLEA